MILEPAYIRARKEPKANRLEDPMHSLVVTLSPVFFVRMESRVDVSVLQAAPDPASGLRAALLPTLGKPAGG